MPVIELPRRFAPRRFARDYCTVFTLSLTHSPPVHHAKAALRQPSQTPHAHEHGDDAGGGEAKGSGRRVRIVREAKRDLETVGGADEGGLRSGRRKGSVVGGN